MQPNGIRCFVAPEYSFDELAEFIQSASHSIEGCQFQLSSPPIVELLGGAIRRNVRVSLLVGEYNIDSKKLKEQREFVGWLSQLGAEIKLAPQVQPNAFHARWLCADRRRILLHTFALTDRALPNTDRRQDRTGNRDFGVIFSDNNELLDATSSAWASLRQEPSGVPMPLVLPRTIYDPPEVPPTGRIFEPFVCESGTKSRFLWGSGREGDYFNAQFRLLESSSDDVAVYMQYFDLDAPESQKLTQMLGQRVRSGQTARVLTQRDSTRKDLSARLNALGIQHRIHFTKLHAKMILTPKAVILQTKDWIVEAVEEWADCGVIIQNEAVAAYFKKIFDYDWDSSALSG